jgi:dTMP kinase
MRGFLLTLEGPDGAGKTTQIELLESSLKTKGFPVIRVREPGGTQLGESVRSIVKDSKNVNLSAWAEANLFTAARAQLIKEVIKPAIENGHIVIADRFSDSTIAYQGYGRGLDINTLEIMQRVLDIQPNLTFILDLSPENGFKRQDNIKGYNSDRIELAGLDFHHKVRQGFLERARKDPARCVVLDALLPVNELAYHITDITVSKAKERGLLSQLIQDLSSF